VIGYLAVALHEPAGYVGGVLVTDDFGLPLEFRHTLPVRPTKLQRALYGTSLDRYLRRVVIARRLLESVEHAPPVVLVDDPVLADCADLPLAHIAESGVEPVGPPGHVEPFGGASSGFLLQLRADEAPLRLVTDMPPHLYPQIGEALCIAARTMDIAEPMQRVHAGVQLIAAGDVAAAA
jgi:hypothetical protein